MNNESPETTGRPVGSSAWLAVSNRNHANIFEFYATEMQATESLDAAEENGDCYSAAIYHVPTKTLKMRDPLGYYDPAKVLASIEEFLTANEKVSDPAT